MSDRSSPVLDAPVQDPGTISFEATDVTGTYRVLAEDVQRSLPAGDVARMLAEHMQLPENLPWGLRDAKTSGFLDPAADIGSQIDPGTSVTVTPRAHLG